MAQSRLISQNAQNTTGQFWKFLLEKWHAAEVRSAFLSQKGKSFSGRLWKPASKRSYCERIHHCSVCGDTKHRLENCPLPGAKVVLALRKRLRLQESNKKSKKLIRVEKTQRKPSGFQVVPQDCSRTRWWQKWPGWTQSCRNSSTEASTSPAWENEEDAFDWLLSMKFAKKITCCPSCGRTRMVGPFFTFLNRQIGQPISAAHELNVEIYVWMVSANSAPWPTCQATRVSPNVGELLEAAVDKGPHSIRFRSSI